MAAILLLLCLMGTSNNDLVGALDAEQYFQMHKIEVQPERLVQLASQDPTDARTQVTQLLAIRWLGEHPQETQKATGARAALEQIAQGKKAQDPQGFARNYARRALAHLEGKRAPALRLLPAGSAVDGLKWFPADVSVSGALDLRLPKDTPAVVPEERLRSLFHRSILRGDQKVVVDLADRVGNLRLDRFSFAVELEPNGTRAKRIYLRCTGAGNPKWLAEMIRQEAADTKTVEVKGAHKEPVLLLSRKDHAPAFALIGNTDLIIAGYDEEKGNHLEVVERALALRVEGKGSVVSGPLADLLKQAPPNASGVLVGDLSEPAQKQLAKEFGFPIAPKRFLGTVVVRGRTTVFHGQGTMSDAEGAKTLAEAVEKLKAQGMEALKNPPPTAKVPQAALEVLQKTLDTLKVEAKGTSIQGSLEVSQEAVKALFDMFHEILPQEKP